MSASPHYNLNLATLCLILPHCRSGKIEKGLAQDYYQQVVLRLNVAVYKAAQFAAKLSAGEYGKALKFAK